MKLVNSFYEILSWDSKFFGYTVARILDVIPFIKMNQILTNMRSENVKLAYWFIKSTTIANRVAEQNNGVLVDEKITFIKDLSDKDIVVRNMHINSYKKRRIDKKLLSLVIDSGKYSRFRKDRRFTHNEFKRLYTEWIQKSILRKKAFDVLIYSDVEESMKGFITLEKKEHTGIIGLIAVNNKYRGKGVGKALVRGALSRFQLMKLTKAEVVTQKRNISAVQFYLKLGFGILRVQNVYHFWL